MSLTLKQLETKTATDEFKLKASVSAPVSAIGGQPILGDNVEDKIRVVGAVTTFYTLTTNNIILVQTITETGLNKDISKQTIYTGGTAWSAL